MQKHLWCKRSVAKESRIIPGSECMNRLATARSNIRIWPRGLHTEHINTTMDTL